MIVQTMPIRHLFCNRLIVSAIIPFGDELREELNDKTRQTSAVVFSLGMTGNTRTLFGTIGRAMKRKLDEL